MRRISVSLIALAILAMAGCKKTQDFGDGWFGSESIMFSDNTRAAAFQRFTVDATGNTSFTTAGGIQFTLPVSPFKYAVDSLPTGNITIEVREFFTNADFINSFISTVSVNDSLLQTAGSFYVTAYKNQLPVLFTKPISVSFPAKKGVDAKHKLYTTSSLTNELNNLAWQKSANPITISGSNYLFTINSNSWWNVAHVPDATAQMTTVAVLPASGYGGLNTLAYFTLPEGGVAFLRPRFEAKFFQSPYMAAGTKGKLLLISRKDNKLQYQLKDLMVTNGLQFGIVDFIPTSLEDLYKVIMGL